MINVSLKDSDNLRLLIAKKGYSLRSYSVKVGISQGYLSQVLTGKYQPSASVAFKIAEGLGRNIEDIFLIKVTDITVK